MRKRAPQLLLRGGVCSESSRTSERPVWSKQSEQEESGQNEVKEVVGARSYRDWPALVRTFTWGETKAPGSF